MSLYLQYPVGDPSTWGSETIVYAAYNQEILSKLPIVNHIALRLD